MTSFFSRKVLLAGLVLVLVIAGISSSPAPLQAQQPLEEDTQTVTVHKDGQTRQTQVLKEVPDPDSGRSSRVGSIILKFREDASLGEREDARQLAGAFKSERLGLSDTIRIQVPERLTARALDFLRRLSWVEYAEPDLIAHTVSDPNDPRFLDGSQWGMTAINAPQAWNTTTGSISVRVAILDCGIYHPGSSTFVAPDGQVGHPDLRNGKVISDIEFSTSTSTDDFCNHGTHVAGIAAANTNNGIGVAGVGFNTKLVNVKVLGDTGSGSFSDIVKGILWAAGCPTDVDSACGPKRAEVINMSLGAEAPCSNSLTPSGTITLQRAIDKAWAQGLVIVAAAGNGGSDGIGDNGSITPGNCNNVISVAASTSTNAKATFSNFGADVDVAAPGVSILSTDYVGTYSSFSGTSMASPQVAGLAALVWSTPYGTSNAAVVSRILTTANENILGGATTVNGLIDAAAAVGPATPDETAPTVTNVTSSTANGAYNAGDTIAVNVTFSENVTVTGTPQLTLETGASDAIVNYSSGSGSATLTFSYTVAAGHTSVDLDYVSTTALALNGGPINDAASPPNAAVLTLPAPGAAGSLGANKNIVIDTTAPDTSITSAPPAAASASASFSFTSDETGSTFQCRLDGGTYAACTSPMSYTGLSNGSHTFEVRSTDPAANTDATPASYSWAVDVPPPPITTTTWRNCGANAAVTASGNGDRNGFTSGSAACTDGGSYANDTNSGTGTSTSCTSTQKDRHLFYNYGLPSIPSGQTIKGIEVRLDAWADSSASSPHMCVQLSWNGGLSWTTAKQTSNFGTSQATYIVGSASDTWGHSWTSSQLSNANFRVRITDVSSSTSRDFRLDWAAVRITYGP